MAWVLLDQYLDYFTNHNSQTTWYHSHFALQAWEGIFGGIVINGPASANYDEDMGLVFLNGTFSSFLDIKPHNSAWFRDDLKALIYASQR